VLRASVGFDQGHMENRVNAVRLGNLISYHIYKLTALPMSLSASGLSPSLCCIGASLHESVGLEDAPAPIPKCRKNQQLVMLKYRWFSYWTPVYHILEFWRVLERSGRQVW